MAYGWSDKTEVFKDALALPRSVILTGTNSQPILNYRVTATTNVLGWEFPLAFKLVQYLPRYEAATKGFEWKLHLSAAGKVTAIGAGTEDRIPTERQKAAGK